MNNLLMIEEMESFVAPDDVADFIAGGALALGFIGIGLMCCGGC